MDLVSRIAYFTVVGNSSIVSEMANIVNIRYDESLTAVQGHHTLLLTIPPVSEEEKGPAELVDAIARSTLGIGLGEIETAFR